MSWWLSSRDWFVGRSLQERYLLGLMAALVVLLIAILLVYRPLMMRLDEAKVRHVAAVQRHGSVVAQVTQLEGAPKPGAVGTTGASLAVRLTDAAARAGISLKANEPRGPALSAITIEAGSPTAALRWLRQLEAEGIRVRELAITRSGPNGVNLTATLADTTAS